MFFMETQLHDIWFCLTHHGRQSSNRCSELLKHEHTACYKNFLSLCFLSLPLGYPPIPQLLAHDLVLFFSLPLSKRVRKTCLHLQTLWNNWTLTVQALGFPNLTAAILSYKAVSNILSPLSDREQETFWQAQSRGQDEQLGDWTVCQVHSHHLWLVSTATSWNFISNLSVQHSDQAATIEMQLVCFCGHFICQCGSRRTPEPTAEHFLCSQTRITLLICCFATHLHSWDTLLKELPASHSLLQTTSFCAFVLFLCFSPWWLRLRTGEAQLEPALLWCQIHLWQHRSPGHSALPSCTTAGGSATPSLGMQPQHRREPIHPSVLQMQEEQAVW